MQPLTKPCPACGYACPPKALKCRGCENWFPQDRPKTRTPKLLPVVSVCALIALGLYFAAKSAHRWRPFPGDSPRADAIFLHLMAQRAVMAQLNWPANATTESLEALSANPEQGIEAEQTSDGKRLWTVNGGVIFTDNAGGYRTQPYHVLFRQDGTTIHDLVVSVNLDPLGNY